tara:strand:- start:5452 stop:5925 length:474 start_codon:yes stop_codon:yes gene_type:complete
MPTIRNAKEQDKEGIANVLVESYNIDNIEEGIQVFQNETIKQHNFIVAEKDGKIIGLTTWLMHGLPKHQLAELVRIAVIPEFQGKGIAKQLFDGLKLNANDAYNNKGSKLRKLFLLTHDNNPRAQAFYKKMGLEHETTLKQHYYQDKDEFVFSMFLD